jgi:hypothetical protein
METRRHRARFGMRSRVSQHVFGRRGGSGQRRITSSTVIASACPCCQRRNSAIRAQFAQEPPNGSTAQAGEGSARARRAGSGRRRARFDRAVQNPHLSHPALCAGRVVAEHGQPAFAETEGCVDGAQTDRMAVGFAQQVLGRVAHRLVAEPGEHGTRLAFAKTGTAQGVEDLGVGVQQARGHEAAQGAGRIRRRAWRSRCSGGASRRLGSARSPASTARASRSRKPRLRRAEKTLAWASIELAVTGSP